MKEFNTATIKQIILFGTFWPSAGQGTLHLRHASIHTKTRHERAWTRTKTELSSPSKWTFRSQSHPEWLAFHQTNPSVQHPGRASTSWYAWHESASGALQKQSGESALRQTSQSRAVYTMEKDTKTIQPTSPCWIITHVLHNHAPSYTVLCKRCSLWSSGQQSRIQVLCGWISGEDNGEGGHRCRFLSSPFHTNNSYQIMPMHWCISKMPFQNVDVHTAVNPPPSTQQSDTPCHWCMREKCACNTHDHAVHDCTQSSVWSTSDNNIWQGIHP